MTSNDLAELLTCVRAFGGGLDETFEANVHHVFLQLLPLFGSRDFGEGVKAFIERREPVFEGK